MEAALRLVGTVSGAGMEAFRATANIVHPYVGPALWALSFTSTMLVTSKVCATAYCTVASFTHESKVRVIPLSVRETLGGWDREFGLFKNLRDALWFVTVDQLRKDAAKLCHATCSDDEIGQPQYTKTAVDVLKLAFGAAVLALVARQFSDGPSLWLNDYLNKLGGVQLTGNLPYGTQWLGFHVQKFWPQTWSPLRLW